MFVFIFFFLFLFFKHKTAYEIVVGDWISDVCSSELIDEQRSYVFNKLQVVPFFDPKRNVLVVTLCWKIARRNKIVSAVPIS